MTVDWNQIITAIISAVSVLAGVGLSEYFKYKERKSLFSEVIFKKKIEIYEDLFYRLDEISNKAHGLVNDDSLSKKERHKVWSDVILPFANFLDRNALYINEKIAVQAAISVVGIEEENKEYMHDFDRDIGDITKMIKEDIGIKRVDTFFKKLNRPNLNGRWTKYVYDELEQKKK